MLITRILVALLGIPLAAYLLYVGGAPLTGALLILMLLGLHELYTVARPFKPNLLVGYITATAMLLFAFFSGPLGLLAMAFLGLVLTFFSQLALRFDEEAVARIAITYFGSLYLALGFGHFILIRQIPDAGLLLAFTVLGATWTGDTLSYVVGRLFGRTHVAGRLSPKKTLEGFIGGFIGSVLVVMLLGLYDDNPLNFGQDFILALAIALAAPLGDLFESFLKRSFSIKDSGYLLPGHGGVLDRFDSLLFSAPAAFYAWMVLH